MIGDILQPTHLLFVLVVALLVLGPKRLPEVGKALGRGLRDFRNAVSGDEIREALTTSPSETPAPGDINPVNLANTHPEGDAAEAGSPAQPSATEPVAGEPVHTPATDQPEPAKQNAA